MYYIIVSIMISNGENILWILCMLGHSTPDITLKKYAKFIKNDKQKKLLFNRGLQSNLGNIIKSVEKDFISLLFETIQKRNSQLNVQVIMPSDNNVINSTVIFQKNIQIYHITLCQKKKVIQQDKELL